MNSEPRVSILMPAYNAQKYIDAAVESILKQSYSNWELLILNDGSTDNTAAFIDTLSDPRIRVFHEVKNNGYLRSCNKLFKLASGNFITFLDADDTCPETRLAESLQAFENNSDLGFLSTDFKRTDKHGKQSSTYSSEVDYNKYASDPNYAPIVCCATIFLKRELLETVGGYHPFFEKIGGEDYHWLFRLSRAGKGVHLNKSLYHYRTHKNQSHHLNSNPLKFYFADIDKEIRASIIEHNIDLLETDSSLEKRWTIRIDAIPSDLTFRQASSMLNRNMPIKAIITGSKAVIISPFRFTSWHRLAYLIYSALMR